MFEAILGKPCPRFRIGKARYWSLLASAPLVPLPSLCHFWKMLHSDSINRIKNNNSQTEKAKSGKTAEFLRMWHLCLGPRETWRPLKSTRCWRGAKSLLAEVTGLKSYMLYETHPWCICSFQTFPLGFSPEFYTVGLFEPQILFGITSRYKSPSFLLWYPSSSLLLCFQYNQWHLGTCFVMGLMRSSSDCFLRCLPFPPPIHPTYLC